jgi:hypothetical protein
MKKKKNWFREKKEEEEDKPDPLRKIPTPSSFFFFPSCLISAVGRLLFNPSRL